MTYKGSKVSHLCPGLAFKSDIVEAASYLIVHPNIDCWEQHLKRSGSEYNRVKLVQYTILSDKGKFTYDFFGLRQLEIDTANAAQADQPVETNGRKAGIRVHVMRIANQCDQV